MSKEQRIEANKKMVDTKKKFSSDKIQEISDKRMKSVETKIGMKYSDYMSSLLIDRFNKMSERERENFFDKATSNSKKYKGKKYILNGEEHIVQGYEPQVLDVLKTIFQEEDIVIGRCNIPLFRYSNNKRRYYPDIYTLKI